MTNMSIPHDDHRRLRAPIDKLMSRGSLFHVEKRVVARTQKLCARLSEHRGTGEVVKMTNALSSYATDIISCLIFAEPSDFLADEKYNGRFFDTLRLGIRTVPLMKAMPWMIEYYAPLTGLSETPQRFY